MPKRKRTAEGLGYLQSMYRQARSRNDSVLRSFDTLEQLVEAGRLTYSLNTSPGEECDGKPHRCERWEDLQRAFIRAGRIRVAEHRNTWEFINARSRDWYAWKQYIIRRRERNRWGEFLRSNYDWGGKTTTCLKQLFALEYRSNTGSHLDRIEKVSGDNTLTLSTPWSGANLPTDVHISVRSEHTGELMHYNLFPEMLPPFYSRPPQSLSSTLSDEETPGAKYVRRDCEVQELGLEDKSNITVLQQLGDSKLYSWKSSSSASSFPKSESRISIGSLD